MKNYKLFLTGLASGVLLALSFPPLPFPLLSFIAFVPLLFALEQNPKGKYLLVYLTFFIYHAGTNWWIGSWQPDCDPYLTASGVALSIIHPFFFMVPVLGYLFIRKKLGLGAALWLFPFFWVSFEWLHSFGDLAYPWLTLGYTQIYNIYWVQYADITGVWGVSFLVALCNVVVLKLIFYFRLRKTVEISDVVSKQGKLRYLIICFGLIIIVPYVYGIIRIQDFKHEKLLKNNPVLNTGIIQPNINPWKKWEMSSIRQVRIHQLIQDSLLGQTGSLDLAIWSETAITMIALEFNANHNFSYIQGWIDYTNTPLLTGFADINFYKPGEKPLVTSKKYHGDSTRIYDSFNSALLIHPSNMDNVQPQIYHKMKLTPFGERIPYVKYFTFLMNWLEWGVGISSWEFGKEQKVLTLKTHSGESKIGTIICIESIYPGFVANYVSLGANVLVIITNDAWYDHTFGPEQHWLFACMRAIETRRYIARCANTGVSGFITPTGQTLQRVPEYQKLGFVNKIPLLNQKTVYVALGDYVPIISTALAVLFIFYSLFKKQHDRES